MTESESEYPHWKTALFGNGHAANLYCAVKYAIWHGAHILLAIIAVAGVVLYKALNLAARAIRRVAPESSPNVPPPDVDVRAALTSERASNIGIIALVIALIVWFGWIAYELLLYALANTILFFAWIGGVTVALVLLAISSLIAAKLSLGERSKQAAVATGATTKRKAGAVKEKSKETRGLRRLLGYCPVSMSLEPKWFDSFTERLFGDDEAV